MSNLINVRFKDGDEDDSSGMSEIRISFISNGYIVSFLNEEEEEWEECFQFKQVNEMLELLKDILRG